MRKSKLAAAISATAILLTVQALPANAVPTTIFSDGFVVGDLSFNMNSDAISTSHIYGWDADALQTLGDSTTHANGEFWFYDANTDENFYSWCDEATADETTSGSDRVVACDAQSSERIYTDLSIKPEVRIFPADANGVVAVRLLYAVTNNGVADVTVDEVRSSVDFDENYGVHTSNAAEGYGFANFDQAAGVNWFNLVTYNIGSDVVDPSDDSVAAQMSTFGSAWQADGSDVMFTVDGDMDPDADGELSLLATDVTFAAGETAYFAFFTVAAYLPVDPSDVQIDAINANTVAFLQSFDAGLNATYGAGIPEGATVLNWNIAEDVPTDGAEELAATGVDAAGTIGFAIALLVAFAAVVISRRRIRA